MTNTAAGRAVVGQLDVPVLGTWGWQVDIVEEQRGTSRDEIENINSGSGNRMLSARLHFGVLQANKGNQQQPVTELSIMQHIYMQNQTPGNSLPDGMEN